MIRIRTIKMRHVFVFLASIAALVIGAPRVKRQYYDYPYYQYNRPFTLSYFRGQPVYPSDYGLGGYGYNNPYYYNQPSYVYSRQPVYYGNDWGYNYGDQGPYYGGPYNNGGLLGLASSLLRSVIG